MRQAFKRNHLQHALAVSRWMNEHQAHGGLDPRSMVIEISLNGSTRRFFPQFTMPLADGGICYMPELQPGVNGFVGWYPFMPKGWPIAQSKLEFKQFAQRTGLRTPAWTHDPKEVKGAFLVKRHISSFGRGQRGPFIAPPPPNLQPDISLATGEYCEQFIMGQLLKAWYWCDELIVAELVDMPFVEGDGSTSIAELVRQSTGQLSSTPAAELLTLQGLHAHAVPAAGRRVCTAYQYLDESNPAQYADYNCRERIKGSALEAQLRQAGQLCWQEIPLELREAGCISSLDAIVDAQGKAWFLEANCNPQLHPAVYDHILSAIFSTKALSSLPPTTPPPLMPLPQQQSTP